MRPIITDRFDNVARVIVGSASMCKQTGGTSDKKTLARPVRRLGRERCRVLQVLARSGHLGVTEAMMMAYGFSIEMLARMACDGFITVAVDTVHAGDRTVSVRRLRITDGGREIMGRTLRQHRVKL